MISDINFLLILQGAIMPLTLYLTGVALSTTCKIRPASNDDVVNLSINITYGIAAWALISLFAHVVNLSFLLTTAGLGVFLFYALPKGFFTLKPQRDAPANFVYGVIIMIYVASLFLGVDLFTTGDSGRHIAISNALVEYGGAANGPAEFTGGVHINTLALTYLFSAFHFLIAFVSWISFAEVGELWPTLSSWWYVYSFLGLYCLIKALSNISKIPFNYSNNVFFLLAGIYLILSIIPIPLTADPAYIAMPWMWQFGAMSVVFLLLTQKLPEEWRFREIVFYSFIASGIAVYHLIAFYVFCVFLAPLVMWRFLDNQDKLGESNGNGLMSHHGVKALLKIIGMFTISIIVTASFQLSKIAVYGPETYAQIKAAMVVRYGRLATEVFGWNYFNPLAIKYVLPMLCALIAMLFVAVAFRKFKVRPAATLFLVFIFACIAFGNPITTEVIERAFGIGFQWRTQHILVLVLLASISLVVTQFLQNENSFKARTLLPLTWSVAAAFTLLRDQDLLKNVITRFDLFDGSASPAMARWSDVYDLHRMLTSSANSTFGPENGFTILQMGLIALTALLMLLTLTFVKKKAVAQYATLVIIIGAMTYLPITKFGGVLQAWDTQRISLTQQVPDASKINSFGLEELLSEVRANDVVLTNREEAILITKRIVVATPLLPEASAIGNQLHHFSNKVFAGLKIEDTKTYCLLTKTNRPIWAVQFSKADGGYMQPSQFSPRKEIIKDNLRATLYMINTDICN